MESSRVRERKKKCNNMTHFFDTLNYVNIDEKTRSIVTSLQQTTINKGRVVIEIQILFLKSVAGEDITTCCFLLLSVRRSLSIASISLITVSSSTTLRLTATWLSTVIAGRCRSISSRSSAGVGAVLSSRSCLTRTLTTLRTLTMSHTTYQHPNRFI